MKAIIAISMVSIGLLTSKARASISSTEVFLKQFHANPGQAMEMLPPEVTEDGNLIDRGAINYSKLEAVRLNRDEMRANVISRADADELFAPQTGESQESTDAEPASKDLAQRLVDGGKIEYGIADLDHRGLLHSMLPVLPWSDSYWPMYKGIIANRYADPKFPDSKKWIDNLQYVRAHPASEVVSSGSQTAINQLSPAEKYDPLVGDSGWNLTNFAWNQGQKHYDRSGVVAGWMGICHGWSAAAHMLAALTTHAVEAVAVTGERVTFYPGDIRALNSMLWANAPPPTHFVGNRCKTSNPMRNRSGRFIDEGCFDTNPATWHLIVTNQLGINKRSFVMDTTFDYQVWNFSAVGYDVTYFNPQSLRPARSLSQGMVSIKEFTVDKFRSFRNPKTKYVIGITMDAKHADAVAPRRDVTSTKTKTLRYVYDLELDANYNIVGGEWYTKAHPDFLWSFAPNAQALAYGDVRIGAASWNTGDPVPGNWADLAKRSSSRGEPLYSVIRSLVRAGQ